MEMAYRPIAEQNHRSEVARLKGENKVWRREEEDLSEALGKTCGCHYKSEPWMKVAGLVLLGMSTTLKPKITASAS